MAESSYYISKEKRLAAILRSAVTDNERDLDEVAGALADISTARFFTRYANDKSWMYWTDKRNILDPLFNPLHVLTDVEQELAKWVCTQFVIHNSGDVFELIAKHNQQINPGFWHYIVWQITHDKERPRGIELAAWVSILLPQAPQAGYRYEDLDYLLKECEWPEDQHALMMLLSHLLAPVPIPETSIAHFLKKSEYQYEYRMTLRGQDYWLADTWERIRPQIKDFWRQLLPTVQKHLTDAFSMNVAFGKAGGDEDPQSFWRSAIESHPQDRDNHRSFDVLVNAGRDILEYLLGPEGLAAEGMRLVDTWYDTQVPLLRRIAIHGVGFGNCWSPDEKIIWLLERDLIYRYGFKHETFQVIKIALEKCRDETVSRLLGVVLAGSGLQGGDKEKAQIREYEKYNLLAWMKDAAPKSKIVRDAVDTAQRENPDFKPREHKDLDFWSGGLQLIRPHSPVESHELVQMGIGEVVGLLVTYKGKHPDGWDEDRRGLLGVLSQAVASDFKWSIRLADRLIEDKHRTGDIWYYLIKGWESKPLQQDEWPQIVRLLMDNPWIHTVTGGACELLESTVKNPGKLDITLLTKLEKLSEIVWTGLDSMGDKGEHYEGGWLTTAINHGAGKLAEFWLHSLDFRKKSEGDSWIALPDWYKGQFERVLTSHSFAAQLARCVLASHLHYLSYLDKDWTKAQIIPLLDYDVDKLRATQAWHGFLVWGMTPDSLVGELKPLFRKAVPNLEDTQDRIRERLFKMATDITLNDQSSSPDVGWLYTIIGDEGTKDEDRTQVVERILATLREAGKELKLSLWTRWIEGFWRERIGNRPVALSPKEADKLIEWTTHLKPAFSEAVDMACQTNGFELEHTRLFSDLSDSDLLTDAPREVIKLLVHILRPRAEYSQHCYYLVPIYRKLKEILGADGVVELTEELVRLGCVSALEP